MLFTTSWDDGHPRDIAVASLLERYGCTGTFYACKAGGKGKALSPEELRLLAERHEIGAHTLTHPSLPAISAADMEREIRGSKEWIEGVLGKKCTMFAYPFGHFNTLARDTVERAGFRGARTTQDLSWDLSDPFRMPTSVQAHYFPFRPVANRRFIEPFTTLWPRLRAENVSIFACRSWLKMAKAAFSAALNNRHPFFHLWGHSWALDTENMWGDFEAFLRFVVSHPEVRPVTNRVLLS